MHVDSCFQITELLQKIRQRYVTYIRNRAHRKKLYVCAFLIVSIGNATSVNVT